MNSPPKIRYGKWFKIVALMALTWATVDTIQGLYPKENVTSKQVICIQEPTQEVPMDKKSDRSEYPNKNSVLLGVYLLLAILIFLAMDGYNAWEDELSKILYGQVMFGLFFLLLTDDTGIWLSRLFESPVQVVKIGQLVMFFFLVFIGFMMDFWASPYLE